MPLNVLTEIVQSGFSSFRRWLFEPIPAYSVVICRVGLGSLLFLSYLSRWSIFDLIYGPEGYAENAYFGRYPESGQVSWHFTQLFDQLQHVSSSALIFALYIALLASSLSFALGIRPKLTGAAALLLHTLFDIRNPMSSWGWAVMIKPFLLYVVLASRQRHWSVRSWIRGRWRHDAQPVEWTCSAWPIRLLQVHITCLFLVLWSRIDEASWLTGQMLFEALNSRDWGRIDFDWHPYLEYLVLPAQAAPVPELDAVIALWIPPIRPYWALALMGMFATLVVTTSVGWWDFMMIFVLSTFLPASWLQKMLRVPGTEDVPLTPGDTLRSPSSGL